jgi:hypothetical protein
MIDIFSTPSGKRVASIILGIGFATMFRRICSKNNCIIIKGPKTDELTHYYKIDKNCYKYNPYPINCPKD